MGITIFELEIFMILERKNIKTITMPTMAAGQKVKPFNKVKTNSDIKITMPKATLIAIVNILLFKPACISLIWAMPITRRGKVMTKYMVQPESEPKGLKLIA